MKAFAALFILGSFYNIVIEFVAVYKSRQKKQQSRGILSTQKSQLKKAA